MTTAQGFGRVPTTDTFGARLALIRHDQGWNQKEAALACGVPHASWRQWEITGSMPRNYVDVVAKVSRSTGIDEYWIMTGRQLPQGPDSGDRQNTHEYLLQNQPFRQGVAQLQTLRKTHNPPLAA